MNLPLEIVEDILSRLPVKPLIRFRCVSKQWETLLTTDPVFIAKHLVRTIQEDESHGSVIQVGYENEHYFVPNGAFDKAIKLDSSYIKTSKSMVTCMVGSSNGLVCFSHQEWSYPNYSSIISIWNPATREHLILPDPDIQLPHSGVAMLALGFGFHPIINEYKVVRLVHMVDPEPALGYEINIRERYRPRTSWRSLGIGSEVEVQVYSLGTNSWRRVGEFPYFVAGCLSKAVLNGVIHWPARYRPIMNEAVHLPQRRQITLPELILSFDMADEVLREIHLPDDIDATCIDGLYVRTFSGCLSMFIMTCDPDTDQWLEINMWVMKDYGAKESWMKLFTMELPEIKCLDFFPLEFLRNGYLLVETFYMKLGTYILAYDLESNSVTELKIEGASKYFDMVAVPYVGSLVPPIGAHSQDLDEASKKNNKIVCRSQLTNRFVPVAKGKLFLTRRRKCLRKKNSKVYEDKLVLENTKKTPPTK